MNTNLCDVILCLLLMNTILCDVILWLLMNTNLCGISRREHAIRELLGRHVQLSREEAYVKLEEFIVRRLNLPPQWIHSAKVTTVKEHSWPNGFSWPLWSCSLGDATSHVGYQRDSSCSETELGRLSLFHAANPAICCKWNKL